MKTIARSALFGLVCAFAATASAKELTTIRVSTIPIIDTAPLQVAIKKGFFEEVGLKVDTTPTAGGAVGLPALAAGAVQVTFSNSVSIALGAAQGLGFKVIAAGSFTAAEAPDIAGIVAKPNSGIKSGADLEGKRLAVNTRNNIIWLYAKAWVDKTGGNSGAVTYLEVPFPQMLDAVASDRVDAAFLVDPFFTVGTSSGAVELVGWPYNEIQPEIPVGMYATTETYLAENPEIIEKFVSAYNKGVDWANENTSSQEWAEIIAGYTRLTPERLADLRILPFYKTIDPAKLQPTLDLMIDYELLREPIAAQDLLHKTVIAK